MHGAPLAEADIAQLKTKMGFDPAKKFYVSDEVYDFWKSVVARNTQVYEAWTRTFAAYTAAFPDLAAELERRFSSKLPDTFRAALPTYTPTDAALATRKLSEMLLNHVAPIIPELIGGSADLTGSNLTRWKSAVDFQAPSTGLGEYAGRYIRFGVREHGMAAICNGLHAYGGLIPVPHTHTQN